MTVIGVYGFAGQVVVGHFDDVVPTIAILGPGVVFRRQALGTRLHRECQVGDLCTGVVVVELAGHVVTGRFQQAADAVADGGTTAMAHMQWPGGVGGNEFDLHLLAASDEAAAEGIAAVEYLTHDLGGGVGSGKEIDEAGAGDFGFCHRIAGRQRGDQRLGQFAWLFSRRLGQHQSQVGGVVAVGLVLGGVDLDRGRNVVG